MVILWSSDILYIKYLLHPSILFGRGGEGYGLKGSSYMHITVWKTLKLVLAVRKTKTKIDQGCHLIFFNDCRLELMRDFFSKNLIDVVHEETTYLLCSSGTDATLFWQYWTISENSSAKVLIFICKTKCKVINYVLHINIFINDSATGESFFEKRLSDIISSILLNLKVVSAVPHVFMIHTPEP